MEYALLDFLDKTSSTFHAYRDFSHSPAASVSSGDSSDEDLIRVETGDDEQEDSDTASSSPNYEGLRGGRVFKEPSFNLSAWLAARQQHAAIEPVEQAKPQQNSSVNNGPKNAQDMQHSSPAATQQSERAMWDQKREAQALTIDMNMNSNNFSHSQWPSVRQHRDKKKGNASSKLDLKFASWVAARQQSSEKRLSENIPQTDQTTFEQTLPLIAEETQAESFACPAPTPAKLTSASAGPPASLDIVKSPRITPLPRWDREPPCSGQSNLNTPRQACTVDVEQAQAGFSARSALAAATKKLTAAALQPSLNHAVQSPEATSTAGTTGEPQPTARPEQESEQLRRFRAALFGLQEAAGEGEEKAARAPTSPRTVLGSVSSSAPTVQSHQPSNTSFPPPAFSNQPRAQHASSESMPFLLECPKCGSRFGSRQALSEHVQSNHLNSAQAISSRAQPPSLPGPAMARSYSAAPQKTQSPFKRTLPAAAQHVRPLAVGPQASAPPTRPAPTQGSGPSGAASTSAKAKCIPCDRVFVSQESLQQHRDAKHSKVFWCNICKTDFTTEAALQKHIGKLHLEMQGLDKQSQRVADGDLVCPICLRKFLAKIDKENHVADKHGKLDRGAQPKSLGNNAGTNVAETSWWNDSTRLPSPDFDEIV